MKKSLIALLFPLAMTLAFVSCSEEQNPSHDKASFTKIYDNNEFSAQFRPIDIKQTADGGFIVLGETKLFETTTPDYAGIYLLKLDENGGFVKEMKVDPPYVHPVADLMVLNNEYYFFCMGENQEAFLAKTDANLDEISFTGGGGGFTFPVAASFDPNNFILLGYDDVDGEEMVISIWSAEGYTAGTRAAYSIGVGDYNLKEHIYRHFTYSGKKIPYQVGRIPGGQYYFNGFTNYNLSMVFTNLQDEPVRQLEGNYENTGFSAITPLGDNRFAFAVFDFDENGLNPNATVTDGAGANARTFMGNSFPELEPYTKVKILRTTISNKSTLVYAAGTKSKQIALIFYDEATGTFLGTKYLGFSNPFELASLIQTEDEGLAVVGTTYVAGRFPRICLFKLSKDELSSAIQ